MARNKITSCLQRFSNSIHSIEVASRKAGLSAVLSLDALTTHREALRTRFYEPHLAGGRLFYGGDPAFLELPDHWIPFYGVGLQFVRGTGKRFYFQDGRRHEDAFHTDDMFVIAPQEIRQYRVESVECKLSMVSIEPVVLQDLVASSPSRNPFELTRTWFGRDPVLKDLVLKLQGEVTAGYPAGPLFGEALCTKIAEEIIQRYSIGQPRLDQYRGGLSGAQLRRVLEYIDEYLNLNLNGNAIANVAGLSKYHFGKAFRQSTGMSLHGYVPGFPFWLRPA